MHDMQVKLLLARHRCFAERAMTKFRNRVIVMGCYSCTPRYFPVMVLRLIYESTRSRRTCLLPLSAMDSSKILLNAALLMVPCTPDQLRCCSIFRNTLKNIFGLIHVGTSSISPLFLDLSTWAQVALARSFWIYPRGHK